MQVEIRAEFVRGWEPEQELTTEGHTGPLVGDEVALKLGYSDDRTPL